jgi:superfamily II DNA or RNA helicase
MAETNVGLIELSNYRFQQACHGPVHLLSQRARCRQLRFDPLRSRATGSIPYALGAPRAAYVSLLAAPETRELLEWRTPQTGLISQSEFWFIPAQHRGIALLAKPAIAWESLEIQRPLGEEFLFCIEPAPVEVPGIAVIPFRVATPQQADCSDLLANITAVSANLFRPLGKSPTGGKDYSRAGTRKADQPAFPFAETPAPKTGASVNGYRKSYTEIRHGDGTTTRQAMSPWDLLLPLLQPAPFDLSTQEQVLLPAELLPHQPKGVEFLASHEAGLLGDGVQTGKTIQTIVAMKLLFQLGKINSALVVCPIPLLIHWQKQLEKWAPELWQGLTVVRNGSPDRRRIMWRMPAHVYATNYETLVADFDEIVSIRDGQSFGLVVADEVQKIKNRKSGFDQLRQLGTRAKYRWGLSATPLENSVEDIVSIFDFLKPGLLRRNMENEHSAKRKIAPYFLRRRTRDVAKYFKEPRHDNYFVRMEGRQLEAYEQAFRESVAELKALGERVTLTAALAKLQALKRLCNAHLPSGESAKAEWLTDTLEEIKASGDKVLLFTQYVDSGRDFLARRLERLGCVTYDSQGSDTQKQTWITTFADDPSKTVFLANPKVAGVGLPDLKAANYVIHFDHWWNPAVEDQANGRILGIGQKKDAFIAHLWVENSIEGRIQEILARKRDLFGRVIDAQSNVGGTGLTESELFELFGLQAPAKRPSATSSPPRTSAPRQVSKAPASSSSSEAELAGQRLTSAGPQQLSPFEFEDLVARLHVALGYATRRTPQTRDGGVDVIAVRDHPTGREKLAIQCKQQEKPVGRPDLQKLLGVVAADPSFSAGVLVTTATFSSDARQFAEQNARLKLVDRNTLALLLVLNRVPIKSQDTIPLGAAG